MRSGIGAFACVVLCLTVATDAVAGGRAEPVEVLRQRAVSLLSGSTGPVGGPRHRAAVEALDRRVERILDSGEAGLDLTGLDDVAAGSALQRYFSVFGTLAQAYRAPGGRHAGDPRILERVNRQLRVGLPYLRPGQPRPGNWHGYLITIPRSLTTTILLMGEALDEEVRRDLEVCLEGLMGEMRLTGANAASEAQNQLYYAFYQRDPVRVHAAVQHVLPAITVETDGGVLEDYAYQFHGRIPYAATYGVAYIGSLTTLAYLVDDSPWELPAERKQVLCNTLLEHMQWVAYGPTWDLSVTGRGHDDRRTTGRLLPAFLYMASTGGVDSAALREAAARVLAVGDAVPLAVAGMADDVAALTPPPLEGFRYYHTSDFGLIRRERFYASVKMYSKRMQDYEYLTHKGRFGWNLSNGLTYVTLGRGELWAGPGQAPIRSWDWDHLPGTTSRVGANPLNPLDDIGDTGGSLNFGRSEFSGGAGDEQGGVMGFVLIPTHGDFVAHKAYSLFDDGFVGLGAGITATAGGDGPIRTTVTQWAAAEADAPLHLSDGRVIGAMEQAEAFEHIRWAWLDEIGYVFFEPVTLHAARNGRLTTLWLDHGPAPDAASYAYVVLPGATPEQTRAYDAAGRFTLVNRPELQAVYDNVEHTVGAVFYEPGTAGPITVDKPAVIYLSRQPAGGTVLAFQNPLHTSETLTVTVDAAADEVTGPATITTDGHVTRVAVDTAHGRVYRIGLDAPVTQPVRDPWMEVMHQFSLEKVHNTPTETLLTVRFPEGVGPKETTLIVRGHKGHNLATLTEADIVARPAPGFVRYRWRRPESDSSGSDTLNQVTGHFRLAMIAGIGVARDYFSVPPFDSEGNALSLEGLPRDMTRPPDK